MRCSGLAGLKSEGWRVREYENTEDYCQGPFLCDWVLDLGREGVEVAVVFENEDCSQADDDWEKYEREKEDESEAEQAVQA
jgi:hypothetical protein